MAGKSIKNLAICQARVKHLLQPKAKSLSVYVWNTQFNSKPPANSNIVEQLKSEEFSQNLTP